jgi:hypothetical protein
MKRFKALQIIFAFMMFILSVFLSAGCGSNGQTGHWLPSGSENIDVTRPRVIAEVPLDGAANIPINIKKVTASFSEAMDLTTLTVTSFTLWCDTSDVDTTPKQITGGGNVTYLAAGYIATLPLPAGANLPANVDCTATITSAATDVVGNQLAGNVTLLPAASNFVWKFHTSLNTDFTAPTVLSTNPEAGANVCLIKTINATFSEAMDPTTIVSATPGALLTFTVMDTTAANADVPGIVTYDVTDMIATFTPSSPLTDGHGYTATITTDATDVASNPLAANKVWSFTADATLICQASIDLKTASTYGIFASADAAITLTGPSVFVVGNAGLMDGAGVCTNCNVTTVNGVVHNGDAAAKQAQIDINAAYTDAAGRSVGRCTLAANTEIAGPQGACIGYTNLPGSIGPTTFNTYLPGLYWSASTIDLGVGKTIVLDAQGDANAVFIFQAGSALTTGTSSTIILANGAQAKNVWWMAATAVTLGVSSTFEGTAIAGGPTAAAITVLNGTSGSPTLVDGRLFSLGAAATVNTFATITVPAL